ncbi:MAG: O-antigen ligase family protein [Verrucomicrobia bacterium]|nr:O-antigen ligase family protein [Verrucomicrobiota bacterium]
MPPIPTIPAPVSATRGGWWPVLAGFFIAFVLLKLGNPVILDHVSAPPAGWMEIAFEAWPAVWGYCVLGVITVVGALQWRPPSGVPVWALALPGVWLAWQFVAATMTVDAPLTRMVLPQFVATVVCFALGLCAGGAAGGRRVWLGLLAGLLVLLGSGFRQQYGGLAASREFFYENEKSGWKEVPAEELARMEASRLLVRLPDGGFTTNPDLLPKLAKDRIMGTLVYPNALAGVVLLLLPGALLTVWSASGGLQNVTRGVLVGLVAYMGLACLFWSGSKAGWLIALVVGAVALLNLPWAKTLKVGLVVVVGAGGLAGFAWKYQSYFAGGARSVNARFDYWSVAGQTALNRPLLGSGPGTFYAVYRQAKRPDAEMARLAHNDYLQQASDSGAVGLLAFGGFIWASLAALYWITRSDWTLFASWLGLLGWALQSFVEFGLYIPALAWTAFFLFGWLWAVARNGFDTARPRT